MCVKFDWKIEYEVPLDVGRYPDFSMDKVVGVNP